MVELYYEPYGVAYFCVSREMGSRTQMEFLEDIFARDQEYIHPDFKEDKKGFISNVLSSSDYLSDKEFLDWEFPFVMKDLEALGRQNIIEKSKSEYHDLDYFFMFLRLRIRFIDGQDYARMKLRTLLKEYGYKRRSPLITAHIHDCLLFYHIQPFLKGHEECDIREIKLDDMITFRLL